MFGDICDGEMVNVGLADVAMDCEAAVLQLADDPGWKFTGINFLGLDDWSFLAGCVWC